MSRDHLDPQDEEKESAADSADGGNSGRSPRVTPLGDNAGVHIASDPDSNELNMEMDFGGFVISLGTSCMVSLGRFENPETGTTDRDLPAAKHVIQILTMLKDKTQGNLEPEEKRLLGSLIYDLRMAYLEAEKSS